LPLYRVRRRSQRWWDGITGNAAMTDACGLSDVVNDFLNEGFRTNRIISRDIVKNRVEIIAGKGS